MTPAEKEIPVSELDTKALEAAARAVWNAYADSPLDKETMPGEPTDWREYRDIPEVMQARCRSYARSAVSAYLAASGDGWLPIESAPKDGTPVWVTDGQRVFKAFWTQDVHGRPGWRDSMSFTHFRTFVAQGWQHYHEPKAPRWPIELIDKDWKAG